MNEDIKYENGIDYDADCCIDVEMELDENDFGKLFSQSYSSDRTNHMFFGQDDIRYMDFHYTEDDVDDFDEDDTFFVTEKESDNSSHISQLENLVELACSEGNYDFNEYMHGMANGLILALAILKNETPTYIDAPEEWKLSKIKVESQDGESESPQNNYERAMKGL